MTRGEQLVDAEAARTPRSAARRRVGRRRARWPAAISTTSSSRNALSSSASRSARSRGQARARRACRRRRTASAARRRAAGRGSAAPSARHDRLVALDLGRDVGDREPDVDEPAGGAVDQAADLLVAGVLGARSAPGCRAPRSSAHSGGRSNTVAHDAVGARDLRDVGAGLLDRAVHERGARPVDHVVDDDGGDDLAVQRVAGQVVGEPLGDRRREVAGEHPLEPRLVGQRGVLDVLRSASSSSTRPAPRSPARPARCPRPRGAAISASVGRNSSARSSSPARLELPA